MKLTISPYIIFGSHSSMNDTMILSAIQVPSLRLTFSSLSLTTISNPVLLSHVQSVSLTSFIFIAISFI